MRRPPSRRLLVALALSILVHLLTGGGLPWSIPADVPESPPIEARLTGPSTEPARPAAPKPSSNRVPPRRAQPPQAEAATVPPPQSPVAPAPEPQPALPAPAALDDAPAAPEAAETAPEAAAPALPEGFKIRFLVQGNEGGFVLGHLTHVWRRTGDRYSIVGVAEASGVMALFYSGLLSQTSDGAITPAGLRPESFWMQRGRRQFVARFDWGRGMAALGTRYGSVPVREGTQDYLSVVYQLALFPREPAGSLAVVNGKRLKEYVYRELGPETLELPMGRVETVHVLVGKGGEEGDIELWLRAEPPRLPVKIRLADNKGRSGVLLAESIEGP